MIFSETKIHGAWLIRPEPVADERGFFARTFCERELGEHGLAFHAVQRSVSYNQRRGTLRGLHFQAPPRPEAKLVSCSRGSIYDVIVDLRTGSPGYRSWVACTLTADGLESVLVPAGCAHGFLTLEDDSAVRYDISEYYEPELARGVRFDDPAFGIEWPSAPVVVSARDLGFPPFSSSPF